MTTKSEAYALLARIAVEVDAIKWESTPAQISLIDYGWASIVCGDIRITYEGREEHAAAVQDSKLPQSDTAFRKEALTGMTSGGKQSTIGGYREPKGKPREAMPMAALNKPGEAHSVDPSCADRGLTTYISLMAQAERRLELSRFELIDGVGKGLIRMCLGYRDSPKDPHLGWFSKTDGNRYRSQCRRCYNERRR